MLGRFLPEKQARLSDSLREQLSLSRGTSRSKKDSSTGSSLSLLYV
jgi:hypothetical protein